MLPIRNTPQHKRPTQAESEGLEINIPNNWTGEKKGGIATFISDKIPFKTRAIKRDPEGHFIILKGRIYQEDIDIINTYTPNIEATKHIRQI